MATNTPTKHTPTRRLVDDREGSAYLGISRTQYRMLVMAGKIPRVVVPAENGKPLRRMLVDLVDLDRLIGTWKRSA